MHNQIDFQMFANTSEANYSECNRTYNGCWGFEYVKMATASCNGTHQQTYSHRRRRSKQKMITTEVALQGSNLCAVRNVIDWRWLFVNALCMKNPIKIVALICITTGVRSTLYARKQRIDKLPALVVLSNETLLCWWWWQWWWWWVALPFDLIKYHFQLRSPFSSSALVSHENNHFAFLVCSLSRLRRIENG